MKETTNESASRSIPIVIAVAAVFPLVWLSRGQGPGDWIVAMLLASASVALLLQTEPNRKSRVSYPMAGLALVLVNLAAGCFFTRLYGSYNALLLFGGFLLCSSLACHLACQTDRSRFFKSTLIVNGLFTAALILTVPQVNGISVLFGHIKFPTTVALHPAGADTYPENMRSRQRLKTSNGQVVKVALHTPKVKKTDRAARVLLRPRRPFEFEIHSIELLSFVGFDGQTLEKLNGPEFETLKITSAGKPVATTLHPEYMEIAPAKSRLVVDVPYSIDQGVLDFTPARRRNTISALVHWQLGFFLFVLLAPASRNRRAAHDA
ncbi:MAG: hypothetical protein QF358_10295 [Arenicellales bacterium]|jgi:hypothetical protein|nr:hypothetical protein [Arenicellales bacterium]|tara:strand:- start:6010 stop:6972 length:963 start_codon:yes stop_codon:yes gene_type:complete